MSSFEKRFAPHAQCEDSGSRHLDLRARKKTMLRAPMGFPIQTKAMTGYVLVALTLTIGMSLSVRRLSSSVDQQIAALRAAELEITLVERLRWRSEVIVADGRGYLLSGDPALLAELEGSAAKFDENVLALGSRAQPFIVDVAQAARNFRRVQLDLVAARQRSDDKDGLIGRFESELLPLRGEFEQSIARLVDDRESALDRFYATAKADRERLELNLGVLHGMLVLVGLAIAFYFAKLLDHSYRQESEARRAAGKALATRDEVMGIVAHDLRNPLGAITMKAALLEQDAESDKARQHARSIGNVAMRMEYLIRTMLDVTAMDAGLLALTPAPCSVDDILDETEAMFEPLAISKQIRLERLEGEPNLGVCAERERVLEVLANLIGNALKFTPQGGHITISADREGRMVRFAVLDTGPGIPPESLLHVFDRFWRKNTSGTKGTGLGLFIAKGIVEAHGGRIWVDSDVNHGAKFFFTLPHVELREAGQRSASTRAEPASPEGGPA